MANIKTAVILAAGLGSRLPSFTKNQPKGFLPIGGIPLIERSIRNLLQHGIRKIIIGTGYMSEMYDDLMKKFPEIVCKRNDQYASTGSMFTLYNLSPLIEEDFLLLESDLLYHERGLATLIEHEKRNVVLASGMTRSGDEVFIEVDEECRLVEMSKDETWLGKIYGELTGISKLSFSAYQAMSGYSEKTFDKNPGLDYEHTMVAVSKSEPIYIHKVEDYVWCEIDNEQHLSRALTEILPLITQQET